MEILFHPTVVAIAGISVSQGRGGHMFLNGITQFDKVKQIHCLNPKGGQMNGGTPLYRNLRDLPGDVDLVISAIPAAAVPELVVDAAARGVKVIHLFTAGVRETGDADRAEMETELLAQARALGVRLVGPNCMGIHSPISGVSWIGGAARDVRRVGLMSQSGMNMRELVIAGERRGLRYSYGISYGNATDLNECDYLDYFAANAETDIVLGYLEGVRDGPRFVRAARKLAAQKPYVVVKGGLTAAGTRAAGRHTGSLAGSAAIWDAVCAQANIIQAATLEELVDVASAYQFLGEVGGLRAAVLGGGRRFRTVGGRV